jgi:hypothetical protein
VDTVVQKLLARAGLLTVAEVLKTAKCFRRGDRPLHIYKGLSRFSQPIGQNTMRRRTNGSERSK